MAEDLRFNIESDKTTIHIFDTTGKYKKNCNEDGWGTPNFRVTDISKAELEVFPPEADTPIIIDLYPSLPNDNGIGFEILAQDLGLDEITSGVWKFTYLTYHCPGEEGEQIISSTCYMLLDDVIECCIENRKTQADVSDVSSPASQKTVELETLLENARWAACKGDRDAAQKIAKYISLQCKCCL
ncbi:MAG: hypothetical protein COA88_12780 [Kordia sp.]|nr:MAG: hypothetical protein COA88_12780 [Kordia sp.]